MTEKEVIDMYVKYQVENSMQLPKYAEVKMYWEDDGPDEIQSDIIALHKYDIDTDDDEAILFYADSVEGLLELMKKGNGSDFVVTDVIGFY